MSANEFGKASYAAFIENARKLGLPTAFLTEVSKRYTFDLADPDGPDHTVKWFHEIDFKASTLTAVKNLSFKRGIAGSVGTVYHESTHAWLWMKEDEQPVKDLIKDGKAYYHGAPLDNDGVVSDDERVFHEAMGEYVGHRASTWFDTVSNLMDSTTDSVDGASPEMITGRIDLIKKQKQRYSSRMAQKVFGYQGNGASSTWTKMAMSSQMKTFCDQTILENKFSDQFEMSPRLVEVWKELAKKYPAIDR